MSASPEIKAEILVEDLPNKVFVGNLPFKTTDEQLKEFFATVGEVAEARVITRGKRSLGYGFVAFASEESVRKAVEAKDKMEMDGRPINVEEARPMTEDALKERADKPAARRRRRRRAARRNENEGDESQATEGASSGRQPAVAEAAAGEEEAGDKAEAARRPRQRRFPKKVEAKESAPSDTVVYVGNLPFATTDDELCTLFSAFSVSSAHVVVSKKTGRSKGFGFVTFATPDAQAAAVAKYSAEPLAVDERLLQIKAALSETPVASDSLAEAEGTV
ncbi:hypothetical protein LPJ61_004419 [Coemansia biformis]|uniref:RRM domain-containing protein n=1 Tax=Coemansia biformis TaxID=1286918 RepID=A0A9W7Y4V6_9FUNG|nr:hypothetical protein LPJ61_004419 [Coemansia biformis]